MILTGFITRRRCIGKKLAFANIQVERDNIKDYLTTNYNASNSNSSRKEIIIIQVVFHRGDDNGNNNNNNNNIGSSSVWMETYPGNVFPDKNTALPYGALVSLDVCELTAEVSNGMMSFDVKKWKLLNDPRQDALNTAMINGTDGGERSCSLYLTSRGQSFLKFNPQPDSNMMTKQQRTGNDSFNRKQVVTSPRSRMLESSHGDNRSKGLRARVFAEWLIETFGRERLASQRGVLDVAGGKGKLSIELSLHGKIPSTIVDPLVRKHGHKLDRRHGKQIQKADCPHPILLAREFNQNRFLEECDDIVRTSSILVGLHPDECTEDVLDVALKYDKPVAIVPCCVFSGLFPCRTLSNGDPVRTYEDFLQYLLLKDDRLRRLNLPFEGKNTVIYMT